MIIDTHQAAQADAKLRNESSGLQLAFWRLLLHIDEFNRINCNQAELADLIGCERKAMERYLRRLWALGLAVYDRGHRCLVVNPRITCKGSKGDVAMICDEWLELVRKGRFRVVK